MSSIDNETLSKIDKQAAAAAQVDMAHHQAGVPVSDATASLETNVSDAEKQRLELLLKNRPDLAELQDKNILKQGSAAPALQAARAELERQRLEDKLEGKLGRRPDQKDLVERGILKNQSIAPSLQEKRDALQRSQLEDKLEKEVGQRPSPEELKAKGILKE